MPMQPIKFYYDFINQSSRALYILLEASKIPYEAVPISVLKGEHLTGEYRDKVTRLRTTPALNDHGFQLSESVAIFRHLSREKLVPEHWYPRKNFGQSQIDEFLEWRQRNLSATINDYFQQKWFSQFIQKRRQNANSVSVAEEKLYSALNDFEHLFLNSRQFIVGDNISIADLVAICEIDQAKYIGYNPFSSRRNISSWYQSVSEELGPYYKTVTEGFENELKSVEKSHKGSISVKQ